ncbi:hypothetical protein EYF80_058647 [Liparis tanakae]|uniref:Uncharacterized protein n=1 Tax=Liparis tanakae TaxID=230148 RepID=A0A4Z2ERI2_9TELE|nr:hypothetical protein EYF80_058647 [Liparis tanakae]
MMLPLLHTMRRL